MCVCVCVYVCETNVLCTLNNVTIDLYWMTFSMKNKKKKKNGNNKKLITTCERTRKEFNINNRKWRKDNEAFSTLRRRWIFIRMLCGPGELESYPVHSDTLNAFVVSRGTGLGGQDELTWQWIAFRSISVNTCTQCDADSPVDASLQSHDIHILHASEHVMWFGRDSEWHSRTSHTGCVGAAAAAAAATGTSLDNG